MSTQSKEHFCINGRAYESEPLHYRECGLDNIFLLNGFHHEVVDGEEGRCQNKSE